MAELNASFDPGGGKRMTSYALHDIQVPEIFLTAAVVCSLSTHYQPSILPDNVHHGSGHPFTPKFQDAFRAGTT